MSSIDLYTEDRLVYQFYPVTSNVINFRIKAPNDAHIALTSTPYESQPMYEVFFGGWQNSKSVIRRNQQQPDVAEAQTPNILDANNYRNLWIRWEYGVLSAGVQGNPQPILLWQDAHLIPIQYFGVCTGWGARGHWIIENPTNNFSAPSAPAPSASPFSGYPASAVSAPGFSANVIGTAVTGYSVPTMAPKWIPSWNGNVPPGAVIGGTDVSGEPIYIARARHEGALLPGKFVPSHRVAYVAWGGRENPKSEYEVLCDCSPQWISAVGQRIPPAAFAGGITENGETLYIGRSHHEGSITPGKVQASHGVCYIAFGGNEVAKQDYEVLVV